MINRPRSASAFIAIALIWLGLLLGISFLATPAKFLAPSLSLPVALDVGRYTFKIFSVVELVLAIALLISVFAADRARISWILTIMLCGLVVLQFAWLLPALDSRVEIILRGGSLNDTYLHNLYIAIESAKAVLLVFLAWYGFRVRDRAALERTD